MWHVYDTFVHAFECAVSSSDECFEHMVSYLTEFTQEFLR
jgi:hypothetical protein